MRILLDTNILARAASGAPGLANELVVEAARHDHVLLVSPFLLVELERVLRYERFRPIHGLSDDAIAEYLLNLQLVSVLVVPGRNVDVVVDDPDDDPVVAAAAAGQADVLCTKDRHLWQASVVDYCRHHGIEVIGDLELLQRLRAVT
jgi:putative PIN family toxin of toxin-antitoxin system